MPNTYERYEPDGDGTRLVERSVAFAGTVHDLQLSDAARAVDSPWFAVGEDGVAAKLPPLPVFIEPSGVDTSVDTPPAEPAPVEASAQVDQAVPVDTEPDTNEAAEPAATDEPAEPGDNTEE